VSRSRPMPWNRLGILISAGILCLLGVTPAARAAGCHVADRPVLGTKLSWEQGPSVDLRSPSIAVAPPVLTHPPCPGEVPHVLNASTVTPGPACLVSASFDPSTFSEPLRAGEELEHLQPLASRLDRPPRFLESHVTIEWSA
jgi:hypothetical protein